MPTDILSSRDILSLSSSIHNNLIILFKSSRLVFCVPRFRYTDHEDMPTFYSTGEAVSGRLH
jgi:hypothetical protein